MSEMVILLVAAIIVGFLLGVTIMLMVRARPGEGRDWANPLPLASPEEMERTDRHDHSADTKDNHVVPPRLHATTGRAALPTGSGAPVAMLMARGGALDGRSWLLRYASSTTIGRFDDCDIAIDDHGVSRLHAQITHRTDTATAHEFAIFDYSSTNGTVVNGQAINAVASLQDGDEIAIGNSAFVFHRVRH